MNAKDCSNEDTSTPVHHFSPPPPEQQPHRTSATQWSQLFLTTTNSMQFSDDFDPLEMMDSSDFLAALGGGGTGVWDAASMALQAQRHDGRAVPSPVVTDDTAAAQGTNSHQVLQQGTTLQDSTTSRTSSNPQQPWQAEPPVLPLNVAIVSPPESGRMTPANTRRSSARAAAAAAATAAQASSSKSQSTKGKKRRTKKQKSTKRKKKPIEPGVRNYVDGFTDVDVLCQRGGKGNRHPGNVKYLELKRTMQAEYAKAPKSKKMNVSKRLVAAIHNSGGRFVEYDYDMEQWFEITHRRACVKAGQTLRENYTPEQLLAKRVKSRAKKQQKRLQQQQQRQGIAKQEGVAV